MVWLDCKTKFKTSTQRLTKCGQQNDRWTSSNHAIQIIELRESNTSSLFTLSPHEDKDKPVCWTRNNNECITLVLGVMDLSDSMGIKLSTYWTESRPRPIPGSPAWSLGTWRCRRDRTHYDWSGNSGSESYWRQYWGYRMPTSEACWYNSLTHLS